MSIPEACMHDHVNSSFYANTLRSLALSALLTQQALCALLTQQALCASHASGVVAGVFTAANMVQARAGTMYAPGLSYAPATSTMSVKQGSAAVGSKADDMAQAPANGTSAAAGALSFCIATSPRVGAQVDLWYQTVLK